MNPTPTPTAAPGPFLGRSKAVRDLLTLVERAAQVDAPVLLTGETGTGKSHLARLLHARSARRGGPFVSVNCAGFPEGLFESEFFGHRRGAFTGAVESRAGLFEEATRGTLFLDEVGELPLAQQAKLLTVLEERRVRAVGASRARPVDARIVTATSREIAAAVESGAFRADLYHRIALIRCELPPLRTRPEDLVCLAEHLLKALSRKYRRPGLELSASAWELVLSHPWPGNVRELAHVLEASIILSGARTIDPDHLEARLAPAPAVASPPDGAPRALPPASPGAPGADVPPVPTVLPPRVVPGPPASPSSSRVASRPETAARSGRYSFFGTREQEREQIRAALVRCRGNRTRAARELGMARNTLRQKVRRYGLE
jgi:two-component system response regulator PilR (NtrC family)